MAGNGGIFGGNGPSDDFLKNLRNEMNNDASDISKTLDRVLRSITDFKGEVEKQKISLNIDSSYSQKIEKMLSDLENDFNRSLSPVKDRIQQQISSVFSSDNVKSDGLSRELNSFSDSLSQFANKISQLSSDIGDGLGSAFDKLNRETVDTLKSFSDVLFQLQQKDLKINNPFPEIIASLDEIVKRQDSLGSFGDVLSNILNIPVQQGTAQQLLSLSDSLNTFNNTIKGVASDDFSKLGNYIDELEKLSQKSHVFNTIAENIKGLSIISNITKDVNDLTSALSNLANAGQNSSFTSTTAAQQTQPQGPVYGPFPAGATPGHQASYDSSGVNANPGLRPEAAIQNSYTIKFDRIMEHLEKVVAKMQLNTMSGSDISQYSKGAFNDESLVNMGRVVEQIRLDIAEMRKAESAFNHHQKYGNDDGARQALHDMNTYRNRVFDGNKNLHGVFQNVDVHKMEEGKYPQEVKEMVKDVKDLQANMQGMLVSQFKINDKFGFQDFQDDIKEANKSVNEFVKNLESQPWDRLSGKIGGIFGSIGSILGGAKGGLTKGLGVFNLGALGAMLSPTQFIGNGVDIYQQQGKLLSDAALAEITGGYDYNPQHVRGVLNAGMSYQEATNGRIQQEDYLRNYTSLVGNTRGHYGWSGQTKAQSQADMEELAATTTIMKGMGVSDSSVNSAVNTFYKELNMSVSETNFQFAKIAQTAQSLNVPLEDHLKAVTNLAMQYKQVGLSADEASNAIGNLMFQGGMTSQEASRFAGNMGSVLGGKMNEGWLAYGAGMMGMDPLQSVISLNYGYNDDGTLKDGVAEQKAQILTNNYRMFGSIPGAGGQYGMIKALESMGVTDQRDVAKFLNHAGDEKWLVNQFKEMDSKANLGDLSTSNAKDKLLGTTTGDGEIDGFLGQIGQASDQLSGIDKSLNALDMVFKDLVASNRETLDSMTDFSSQIETIGGKMNDFIDTLGDILKKIQDFTKIFGGDGLSLSTLLGAGLLAGPLVAGAGKAVITGTARRLLGKNIAKNTTPRGGSTGGGGSTPRGGSATKTPSQGGVPRAKGGGGAAKSIADSGAWYKKLIPKTVKGKAGLIAGGLAVAGGLWAATAHGAGSDEEEAGGSLSSGLSGAATLDDIYDVLQNILLAVSGGGMVGGGVPALSGMPLAGAYSVDSLAGTSGLNEDIMGTNPLLNLGVSAGGAMAAGKATDIIARMAGGGVAAAGGKAASASTLSKLLKLGGKSNIVSTLAFSGISAGFDMHDAHELDELYGITNHSKSDRNILGRAAFGAGGGLAGGALAGAALGSVVPGVGTVIGGLVGGAIGYWGGDKIGEKLMGATGNGEEDIEAARMRNPLYKATQEYMSRNAGVGEKFAITANKGLLQNKEHLSGLSTDEKDIWGAVFANLKGEGKSDEEAKQAADKMFRLNYEVKDLNAQQLASQMEFSQASGTYYEKFDKYREDYSKDSVATNKIISETMRATGMSSDTLAQLFGLTSTLPEDLAAAIKASGGTASMDNDGKLDEIRSSMSALGIDFGLQEKGIEGYGKYSASLKQQVNNDLERDTWLEAYAMNSTDAAKKAGLDPLAEANKAATKMRFTSGAMETVFANYRKDMGNAEFRQELRDVDTPDGMSEWKVIANYANALGLDAGAMKRLANKNGISTSQFSKYLTLQDSTGTFTNRDRAFNTLNGNYDYADQEAVNVQYTNEQLSQTGASNIETAKEQVNVQQSLKQQADAQYRESEKTKKEVAETDKKTQEDIYKQTEESEAQRNKDQISALKSLQDFLGDNLRNIWNKLEDINNNIINAFSSLGTISGTSPAYDLSTFSTGTKSLSGDVQKLMPLINKYAAANGLDPDLVAAQMMQESGGRGNNVMQVVGMDNSSQEASIKKGTEMLASYMKQTNNNVPLALGMYNMGAGFKDFYEDGNFGSVQEAMSAFSQKQKNKYGYNVYGDPNYQQNVLRYYNGDGNVSGGTGAAGMMGALANLEGKLSYQWGGGHTDSSWEDFIKKAKADCSGLVEHVYKEFLGIDLGNGTADSIFDSNKGQKVSNKSDLKAGDLVFFGSGSDATHVGIYAGNGQYYGMNSGGPNKSGAPMSLDPLRGDFIGGKRFDGANVSSLSGYSNTAWSDVADSLTSLNDTVTKAANDQKNANADAQKAANDTAKNTADIAANTSTSTSNSSMYKAVLTNIGENDPYAGINIKGNMNNTKYIYDMYSKLGSKGIDYDDFGIDQQKNQMNMRNKWDVAVKVDFSDPSKMPYFTQILEKHINGAVNNAVREASGSQIAAQQAEFDSLWLATAASANQVNKGNYDG